MRPLSRPAAFAVILALVLALVPATTASATLPVPPSTTHLFAVDFIDANNGWAAGGFFNLGTNYAVVERTTNGGTTWTRTTVQPPLGQIKGISFVSATVGYAVDGEPDHVFKTTDGGATWSEMLVTTDLLKKNNSFIAVRFFDALHGYVAGQNSGTKQAVVWSTSNGGTSWTRALLGPEHLDSEGNPIGDSWFQALEGYDASHVMAVGVDVILSSTPVQTALGYKYNGSTWATQTMPVATTNFFGVAYPDASHGVAVGPSGFAASFNGSSWTAVSSGTSSDLQGAAAADATHAWAVGTGGAIRFWNGSGFASQTSGTSVTLRGVAAASTTAAWAVGDNDTILKTTDGGAHWTPRAAPGDYTAPVTTISGVPAGWTKSNVSFTLTAVDEPGNTITTKYRYNAGDYQIYPGHAVTLAVEGQTLISYYSYDQSSNVEPVKSVTAKVDKSAPVTGISTAADVGSTAVVLYPSDTYSGVAATYHTVDGGAPQTGTAFVLSTLGDHIVTWYSTDNAGNVETVHSDVVNVANVGIDPIAGDNRYETAVLAVERAFPTGAGTVVIASGQNFPDALGGSALCGAWGAPLLLTQKDALPTVVRDEIVRLHPSRAIILGSTSAVSAATAQLISPLVGGNVQRIGGIHRYDTAAQVATATMSKLATSSVPDVFLAVGDNFPDALAASPAAYDKKWPILLTTRTGLPPQTLAALAALKPARVHVLGSPATVPDAVLGQLPAGITADRWAGTTRYGTAVDVANKSGLPFTGIAIATGQNFPDALAGGVMQGKLGGPVLLTPTAYLATETSAAIAAHKAQITAVRYLGSTTAVSDAVRTSISNLLK